MELLLTGLSTCAVDRRKHLDRRFHKVRVDAAGKDEAPQCHSVPIQLGSSIAG